MRCGLIAQKMGMTRLFDENSGNHIPVTVLKVDSCKVVGLRTLEKDGYTAVQVGYGLARENRTSKAVKGQFAKAGVNTPKKVMEFRVEAEMMPEVGDSILADHFVCGQYVDVSGISIGKGFAGGMKRHGFAGLPASHGVSVSHRSIGSTGNREWPGRVFKNKKMPGQMGAEKVSLLNLEIVSVDSERGLLMVRGGVPGAKNGYVTVLDAVKKSRHENAPVPGSFKKNGATKVAASQEANTEESASKVAE
jgi:large subunit ribosomal protein L3